MSKKSSGGAMPMMDHDYRSESDHRTLMDAADINSDKDRMRGVRKHHRKMNKKMSLVQRSMMGRR